MEPKEPGDKAHSPPGVAEPADAAPPSRGPGSSYQQRGNVAAKAFRGLFWMVSTGVGSRIVSLVSTLLLTRYVLPDDYGEVQNTFIVVWMVDLLSQFSMPQYVATRADITPRHIHHATIVFHLAGVLGMGLCLLLAGSIGPSLGAPHMAAYMPGFVLATLFQRLATMPDRILVRELRFGTSSAIRGMSEVAYALVSLGLAAAGKRFDFSLAGHALMFGGGFAIVWGGIARGVFRTVGTLAVTRVRDWFAFVRPEKAILRELFAFGVPITIAGLGSIGARRWDNLVIGNLYGPTMSGIYNFAYNLADVPPSVVGESLGDVLGPTFAKVAPADRWKELVRWISISALVCFPLGVGLSAVSGSLAWLFNDRWLPAMPMIVLLGSLSLTRPILGTAFAYLQALGKARTLMILEWAKAIGIVIAIFTIGRTLRAVAPELNDHWGPLVACGAVGVVMVLNTLGYQILSARAAGIPASKLIWPMFPPLFACVPLVGAVLGVRLAFGPVVSRPVLILRLCCEIVAGAVAFVAAALVVARPAAKELIELMRDAVKKRRGGGHEAEGEGGAAA